MYKCQDISFNHNVNLKVILEVVRGSPKSLGFIIWESWMSVPNFVPIHWVDVAIFPRICEMFDLVVNVCTKFHCKSSVNSCQDISINTANCGPQSCTIRKVRSSQKSLEFVLHEWPWMSVTNFLWIHPQIVEISQSGNCKRWFFFLLTSYYLVLTRTQQHRSKILWAQERKKKPFVTLMAL